MSQEPATESHPSSSASNYAFPSHSQDTLPASTDDADACVIRRRRRRTSPHDQAILEREYRKCQKPDKARRREISKLVQMGEKEVQIWFCNKRQAQRRRSTPLQPHERIPNSSRSSYTIAPSSQPSLESSPPPAGRFRRSSTNINPVSDNSVSCSAFPLTSSPSTLVSTSKPRIHHRHHHHLDYSNSAIRELRDPDSDLHTGQLQQDQASEQLVAEFEAPPSKTQQSHDTSAYTYTSTMKQSSTTMTSSTTASKIIKTPEAKMTASAHKRLQDVLNGSVASDELVLPPLPSTSVNPRRTSARTLPPPRLLRRSSSNIRLTTSLEGKATVVLEDVPPSSPPKPPQSSASVSTRRRPLSTPVDSKLWEFCCDNQSAIRSPSQTPVQPSEATQALRLLRRRHTFSTSNGTTRTVPSLPQTLPQSQSTPALKVQKSESLKPTPVKPKKLYPTSSPAVKRTPLKAKGRKVIMSAQKVTRPKQHSNNSLKKKKSYSSFEPSIDSDKENNEPGTPFSPPPESKRRGLGVAGKGFLNSNSTPSKRNKNKRPAFGDRERKRVKYDHDEGYGASQETTGSFENDSQDSEIIVASQDSGISTGGGLRLSSPRRLDEMECVENLLSLRGGTWR